MTKIGTREDWLAARTPPLEKLLAYRRRMGWSFNWASSYEGDFNLDFGVSVGDHAHDAVPLLLANEVAAFPLLGDQQVRDSLPPVATQNADATGTDIAGYFSEGHGVGTFARDGSNVYHCYSSYARGTEFLMGYYAILDRTPKGRDENGEMWLHPKTARCGCTDTTSTTHDAARER